MALREEAQRGQVPFFIASHRKSWHRHDVTRDVSLELLAEQCCQVSPPWNYAPPPFHSALWKEVTTCSMHIRGGKLCSISLRTEHLHKVFGIFLHRRYVSSPPFTYLFSYLFLLPGDFCLHVVFHLATCLVLIRRHSYYVPS